MQIPTKMLFRRSLALFQQRIKQTTGLVGVHVQPRWREMIMKLCDDGLQKLSNEIPKGTFYRTVTENNLKYFQKVVQENDDYEVVEEILNRGQVEEFIMHLEDELLLICKMAEWKPWIVDDKSIELEYKVATNGDDFSLPHDFVPPEMKYLKWDGMI